MTLILNGKEVTLKGITDIASYLSEVLNEQAGPSQVVNTTTTTKNSSVTLFALDALQGPIKDIVVDIFLYLDAAATFTPTIHKTDEVAPTTFTAEAIPAISTIATPAASKRYRYACGSLLEGQQMEVRIAQDNAGAATVAVVGAMSYN